LRKQVNEYISHFAPPFARDASSIDD